VPDPAIHLDISPTIIHGEPERHGGTGPFYTSGRTDGQSILSKHGHTGTNTKTTSTSGPEILPYFTNPRTAEGPGN